MAELLKLRMAEILLIVDDAAGEREITATLMEFGAGNRLSVVRDGAEALEFLGREGAHAGAPRPDLILLDLYLAKQDAREVLRAIKSSRKWRDIPVVVMTSSLIVQDMLRNAGLGAEGFVRKPVRAEQLFSLAARMKGFGASMVVYPAG